MAKIICLGMVSPLVLRLDQDLGVPSQLFHKLVTSRIGYSDTKYGLLRLYFDDIRDEEWTPNYAGASARMDLTTEERTNSY